jgi:hypothetical protein
MQQSSFPQATNRFLFLDWLNEITQIALFEKGAETVFQGQACQVVKTRDERGDMTGYLTLCKEVPDA